MTAAAGAPDEPSPGRDRDLPDLWLGRYLYGRRAMAPGVISRSLALDLMRPRIAAGESPLSARLLARHRSALTFLGRDGEVAIAPAHFPELAFAGASSPPAPATRAAAPLRREARPASVAAPRSAVIQRRAMATPPRADAKLAPQAVPPLVRATKTFNSLSAPAPVPVASIMAPAPAPVPVASIMAPAPAPVPVASITAPAPAPVPVASIMAPAPALVATRGQPSPTPLATAIARKIAPTVFRSAVDPPVLRPLSLAAAGVPVATVRARPVRAPMPADCDVATQPAIPKSPDQAIRPRRIVGAPMRATALAESASAPVASADGLSTATNINVLPAGDLIAPAMTRAAPEPFVTARARSLPPATDVTVLPPPRAMVLPLPPRAMVLPHERVAALPLPVAPRPPVLPAPDAASEPRPPALAPLFSATVTHTAFVSSRPEPSASAAPASAATRQREADKPAALDVGRLAERVYQLLLERLSDERRRRGI
jgi:hypothetical protein